MMDPRMDPACVVPSPFGPLSNTPIRRSCCGCFPAHQGPATSLAFPYRTVLGHAREIRSVPPQSGSRWLH
jgi:hypothetical protein